MHMSVPTLPAADVVAKTTKGIPAPPQANSHATIVDTPPATRLQRVFAANATHLPLPPTEMPGPAPIPPSSTQGQISPSSPPPITSPTFSPAHILLNWLAALLPPHTHAVPSLASALPSCYPPLPINLSSPSATSNAMAIQSLSPRSTHPIIPASVTSPTELTPFRSSPKPPVATYSTPSKLRTSRFGHQSTRATKAMAIANNLPIKPPIAYCNDYQLAPDLFEDHVQKPFGLIDIDLFASKHNKQVPAYCTEDYIDKVTPYHDTYKQN
ncbi:hypothetical protein SARC_02379 [Sphaeroforma arctica JP610]|uniref:Uncharacterized protein n=1 Tax=Sphaeroforma arctica JP610 TaxID=667725 RepID=A0A0L0G942_9EUKA|nr:hypothetical protein SARC_02379 [Sphaeroforma arctica JP610]KNC85429.1 hypothetical protein SARC_02379 [Sphaeroforma arctica JP610]|eukprot:XP_014159331.1 hypothetical protein SARC_02379 [Sphaeroforma arctica JP610]